MPSGLKIVHWNLHSIAPHQGNTKLDELKLLLSNPGKECHILGITETWLDANFTDSEIQIPGYNLERLDRAKVSLPFPKNGGGGIAVYIDKKIPYLRREDLESKDIESVWIKLSPPKRPAHLVCFCYRCPQYDVTSWMNKFENQIILPTLKAANFQYWVILTLTCWLTIPLQSHGSNLQKTFNYTSKLMNPQESP